MLLGTCSSFVFLRTFDFFSNVSLDFSDGLFEALGVTVELDEICNTDAKILCSTRFNSLTFHAVGNFAFRDLITELDMRT